MINKNRWFSSPQSSSNLDIDMNYKVRDMEYGMRMLTSSEQIQGASTVI